MRIRSTNVTCRLRSSESVSANTSSRSISRFSGVRSSRFRTSNFRRWRPSIRDKMLIATSLAAALCASSVILPAADHESAAPPSAPPIIVTVSAPGITPTLLRYILGETDAIWRDAGVSFVWRSAPRDAVTFVRGADAPPLVPAMPNTLRLVIGDSAGAANGETLPLGWIVFDDVTTPEQEVYVSYANAMRFLIASRGVVGFIDNMPNAQREQLLGRAMG